MLTTSRATPAKCTHDPYPPIVRKSKYLDPIFKRRNYLYSITEVKYIHRLSPLESIPRSLIPSSGNPDPPILLYGWVLDDRVKDLLLQEARDRDLLFISKAPVFPDDYDYEAEHALPVPESDFIEENISRNSAALDIFQDLGLKFPTRQFVNLVTAAGHYTNALTLYTSHDLKRSPSIEDIEKARVCLGFPSQGSWFPSGVRFQWVD